MGSTERGVIQKGHFPFPFFFFLFLFSFLIFHHFMYVFAECKRMRSKKSKEKIWSAEASDSIILDLQTMFNGSSSFTICDDPKQTAARSMADADIMDLSQAAAPCTMTRLMSDGISKTSFDDGSQRSKEDLIEQATARLRRRMLQDQLSNVMQQVIQTQSQLEVLRVETAATIRAVENSDDSKCRLDSLERRLVTHQKQLQRLQNASRHVSPPGLPSFPSFSSTISMSNISSLFSRQTDARKDDNSDDNQSIASSVCSSLLDPDEKEKRRLRRERVKNHRQRYEQKRRMHSNDSHCTDVDWNDHVVPERPCLVEDEENQDDDEATCYPTIVPAPAPSAFEPEMITPSTSSSLSVPHGLDNVSSLRQKFMGDTFGRHPLSPITPDFPPDNFLEFFEKPPQQRNTLEDGALGFLDRLTDYADDGGLSPETDKTFGYPDNIVCYQPRPEPCSLTAYDLACIILSPTVMARYGLQYIASIVGAAFACGWRWCKFLIILFAALMISLINGPQDILDVY